MQQKELMLLLSVLEQIKQENICQKHSLLKSRRTELIWNTVAVTIIFRMDELKRLFVIYVRWLDVCWNMER